MSTFRINFVADPNKPVSEQLLREAKVGLTIVALLVALFCYVAWNRFTGRWDSVPAHVATAPLAQNMNEVFREEKRLDLVDQNSPQPGLANSRSRQPKQAQVPSQTFARGNTAPKPDEITSSPVDRGDGLTPITTNDLRALTNARIQDKNLERVNYEQDLPQKFDDPFGPGETKESKKLSSQSSPNDFKPKSEVDSKRDVPSLSIPRKPFKLTPSSTTTEEPKKENKAKINKLPERDGGFRPRTSNDSLKPQHGVVMQSTRFQVQVDPEPESELPTQISIDDAPKYEIAQRSEPPVADKKSQVAAEAIETKLFDISQNDLRSSENEQLQASVNALEVAHKPLTCAEDFATHSLHPRRPTPAPKSSLFVSAEKPAEVKPKKVLTNPAPTAESILPKVEPKSEQSIYTVETDGETLWSIAQNVYDDGRLFQAVYEYNRNQIKDPEALKVGIRLRTPPLDELVKSMSDFVPQDLLPVERDPGVYVTFEGDTLFDIARQKLGQASRFNELVRLNGNRLPSNINHLSPLPAGMRLSLPQ